MILNFLQGEAVTTFVGHTQCVSSVVWPEHDVIYSSSWDHSVRRWDVETGKESLNLVCLLSLLFFLIYLDNQTRRCCKISAFKLFPLKLRAGMFLSNCSSVEKLSTRLMLAVKVLHL